MAYGQEFQNGRHLVGWLFSLETTCGGHFGFEFSRIFSFRFFTYLTWPFFFFFFFFFFFLRLLFFCFFGRASKNKSNNKTKGKDRKTQTKKLLTFQREFFFLDFFRWKKNSFYCLIALQFGWSVDQVLDYHSLIIQVFTWFNYQVTP